MKFLPNKETVDLLSQLRFGRYYMVVTLLTALLQMIAWFVGK
jgi:hypothetical protein